MLTANRVIISSLVGAVALSAVLLWSTYMSLVNSSDNLEGISMVYEARENDDGV